MEHEGFSITEFTEGHSTDVDEFVQLYAKLCERKKFQGHSCCSHLLEAAKEEYTFDQKGQGVALEDDLNGQEDVSYTVGLSHGRTIGREFNKIALYLKWLLVLLLC